MPCECADHRQDRAAQPWGAVESGRLRGVIRAADAPLPYPRFGRVEHAVAGDLGEIQVGALVEAEHGGRVVGRVVEVHRTDSTLAVEVALDSGESAEDLAARYPHFSADYRVGSLDESNGQRGVKIERIALVPAGRCGDSCFVRKDSTAQVPQGACYSESVTKIKIAGKEYVAGSPECAAAMELEAKRLDAADARIRAEESKALRTRVADAFGVEIRKDAADQEILIEAVKQIAPGVDLSSASPDYVAGAFAVALAMALDLKGKADEPGPDDQPESAAPSAAKPPAAPAGPRADGASSVRAAVFTARKDQAAGVQPSAKPPALSPSEKAHAAMLKRNRERRGAAPTV